MIPICRVEGCTSTYAGEHTWHKDNPGDRVIEFHLDEISAWQSGERDSQGCPFTGTQYAERMLDAIARHERELITLGHQPTIDYVTRKGFAEGKRGLFTPTK